MAAPLELPQSTATVRPPCRDVVCALSWNLQFHSPAVASSEATPLSRRSENIQVGHARSRHATALATAVTGTPMRLSHAKENRPSLPAKLRYSLAFPSGEAIDQKGKIGLCLLLTVKRALFLVRSMQWAALSMVDAAGFRGHTEEFGL